VTSRTDATLTICALLLALLILYWLGTLEPAGPEPLGLF